MEAALLDHKAGAPDTQVNRIKQEREHSRPKLNVHRLYVLLPSSPEDE